MVSVPWGSGTVLFQNRDWPSEVMVEYSSVSNMKGETECPKASEMLWSGCRQSFRIEMKSQELLPETSSASEPLQGV